MVGGTAPLRNRASAQAPRPAGPSLGREARASAYTVLIDAPFDAPSDALLRLIAQEGFAYELMLDQEPAAELDSLGVQAVLLDVTSGGPQVPKEVYHRPGYRVPMLALLSAEQVLDPLCRVATDDFIVFPWGPGELTVRVLRLIERRQQTPPHEPGVIRAGDLVIDTNRYDIFVAGRPIVLTFKEYELLKLLASQPGRVFSREMLLEQVWGYEYFGGTRTVDVHIRRLRSKIEDATHTFIDTVWNVGYRFRI